MDTAGAIAAILRDYGLQGFIAIETAGLVFLARELRACFEARIAAEGRVATKLEQATATLAALSASLEGEKARSERLNEQLSRIGTDIALIAAKAGRRAP